MIKKHLYDLLILKSLLKIILKFAKTIKNNYKNLLKL